MFSCSLDFLKSEGDITRPPQPRSPQRRPPHPRATSTSLKRPPPLPSCSSPDLGYPPTSPSRGHRPNPSPKHNPLGHTTSTPDLKSPPPLRPNPSSSPNLQSSVTRTKAPLPKPRQRKPSQGDDSDPVVSPTHLTGSVESDPRSPPPPVTPRTNREPFPSAHAIGSGGAEGQGDMLTSVPVQAAPRNRVVISEKVASLQIQPNGLYQQQREREVRENHQQPQPPTSKAPPVPRKRTSKTTPPATAEVEPKAAPPTATPTTTGSQQMSLRKRKGGGIRVPLWQAPPPPSWTPPPTPAGTEPSKKEK